MEQNVIILINGLRKYFSTLLYNRCTKNSKSCDKLILRNQTERKRPIACVTVLGTRLHRLTLIEVGKTFAMSLSVTSLRNVYG